MRNLSLFGITVFAKAITRYIFANLIAFYSFSSVFFFQNVKLDFAMTLKKQKLTKISIHEISKIEKLAKISFREIRRSVIRGN